MVLHVKFEFHSNRDTLIYFTAKNKSKSFICIYGLWPHIWYTHSNSECLDPYWPLSCLGNYWTPGGQIHSKGGVSRAPSQWHMRFEIHQNQVSASKEFSGLFSKCWSYQFESWFIHLVGCTTYWVHVSLELDLCDLHVLSLGTVN